MTNKEVKSWLDILIQGYIYEDVEDELIEMRDIIYSALDTQALEQTDVLDKVRTEIKQAADKQFQIAMGVSDLNERYAHVQMENAYRHSLNIIDKYKAESEG